MWTGRNLVDKSHYTFYTQKLFNGSQKCQDSVTGSLNNFIGFGLFGLGSAGFNLAKMSISISRGWREVKLQVLQTHITQQYYLRVPSCKGRRTNKLLKLQQSFLTHKHRNSDRSLNPFLLSGHTLCEPTCSPSHYTP